MKNKNCLNKRLLCAIISSSLLTAPLAYAEMPHQPNPTPAPLPSNSLKGVAPPEVPGIERYVKDKKAAITITNMASIALTLSSVICSANFCEAPDCSQISMGESNSE